MKKNKRDKHLILEFTEFNLQRMNPDSFRPSMHVDNPQLSTDAFDKHQSSIRQSLSRLNSIMFSLNGNSAYGNLRSQLLLEEQNIQGLKILRIVQRNNIIYDVYLSFVIKEREYWGKISDILSHDPKFESEVFSDQNLLQPKEWIIKTKGLIIKTIKKWLQPETGMYRLINDYVTCYSTITGKQLEMNKGIEIELVRSYDNKIIVRYESDTYSLVNENYIYFNWWFEKINEEDENQKI